MKRKLLCVGLIAAVCLGSLTMNADAASSKAKNAKDNETQVMIGKLRGKILYKQRQIHTLEKGALEANSELKTKIDAMEKERRAQYIAVEPKLEELYKTKDELQKELDGLLVKAE